MCSCLWCASCNTFQWLHNSICTPNWGLKWGIFTPIRVHSNIFRLARICTPPLNMRSRSWLNNKSGRSQGIWCWLESVHPEVSYAFSSSFYVTSIFSMLTTSCSCVMQGYPRETIGITGWMSFLMLVSIVLQLWPVSGCRITWMKSWRQS